MRYPVRKPYRAWTVFVAKQSQFSTHSPEVIELADDRTHVQFWDSEQTGDSILQATSTTHGTTSHPHNEAEELQARAAARCMMTRRGYGRGEHLDIKALWGQNATEQERLIDPAESDTRTLSAERIGSSHKVLQDTGNVVCWE